MKRNLQNKSSESQERWDFIERTSREVDSWPDWKKSEMGPNSDVEKGKKDFLSSDKPHANGMKL